MRILRNITRALTSPRHMAKPARAALTRAEAESAYLRDLI